MKLSVVTCQGWWEQSGFGRQPMNGLMLAFRGDQLAGQGSDIIGDFEITGTLREGNVSISKNYVGAHSVDYFGTYDGEGTLQGAWSIFGVGGRWLIRVVRGNESAEIVDL